jgi:type IV pilus assembly protein PilA
MLKKFLKNDKGLTLVELLAVIVILGIIAAIAVPSIGGIINKSKDDAKVAEAIQIINAAKLAYAENSEITTWKHEPITASGAPGLKTYVSKVKDIDYTVTYNKTTDVYSISDHDATATMTGKTANAATTEEELAKEAS